MDRDATIAGVRVPARRRGRWTRAVVRLLARATRIAAAATALLALPFFLLVRGSVWAYRDLGWPTWGAVAGGLLAAGLVVLAYAALGWRRFTGRRLPRLLGRATLLATSAYGVFALLYLSAAQAKSAPVRAEYTALHPLLRLATSTWLMVDRDAVVTDMARTAEDYLRMGLPVNEASLHFRLEDRWVHALDLRTAGRPEWRNRLVGLYFRAMGFRTLRHVGTADHLHVSLPRGDG
ncbi:MAG: hypothetical protein D6701_05360 [Gemmatimonadetes bacterium]|nr:MAG: hypothetical protein D6701_05360 [Gemmatimonadota bacterium]